MKKKILCAALVLWTIGSVMPLKGQSRKITDEEVLKSVKRATAFMIDKVSYDGGFVWQYLPDLSRQWGEMEARRTMAWTQGEGTPAMGHFFLDLYHATGDEYYYQCAEKVAGALIWGQHPAGGWNYTFDFAGEASLRNWYETIGQNGWRLEEFHHYYGNCTYDDDATMVPARFLLRIYGEKHDPKYRPAIDRVVNFVLESQYPIGGWPQRYPLMYEYSKIARGTDYSHQITYNDGVHQNNVEFLLFCYEMLGEKRLVEPILRAMNCTLALQQGNDQPGWADQYSLDYRPAGARSYEPVSVHPRTTSECIMCMMDYYQVTGDKKFLARLPEAIAWLEKIQVPADTLARMGFSPEPGIIRVPRYVQIGTDLPLSCCRFGSNVVNGKYVTVQCHSEALPIRIARIKERYQSLVNMNTEEATKDSPLKNTGGVVMSIPRYVQLRNTNVDASEVRELLSSLNTEGYWLVPLQWTSNPYRGTCADIPEGFVDTGSGWGVGDDYDTSPYRPKETIMGITTKSYMENIGKLIGYIQSKK